MNTFNELFPAILLAYVADVGCELTNSQCNELSKYVSGLEWERDALRRAVEDHQRIINKWVDMANNYQDRCVELESRLDLYNGNMLDVVIDERDHLRQELADLQVIFRRVSNALIKANNRIIELEAQK